MRALLVIASLSVAMPVAAQSVSGIESVKVKTIAVGRAKQQLQPATPSVADAKPAPHIEIPPPRKVHTYRVDRDGHVFSDASR